MGIVFEWPSTNLKIAFPFIDQVTSISNFHELFVDAHVVHNKELDNDTGLKLTNFNPTGVCKLEFGDATVLCDLTAADGFTSTTYGPWTVLQWYKQTDSGIYTDEELIVRFLLKTDRIADFSFPAAPTDAILSPACVCPAIEKINRIIVRQPDGATKVLKGDPIIQGGYNVETVQRSERQTTGLETGTTTDERPATYIAVNMVPGLGEGKFPCVGGLGIKTINGVGPDENGNIFVDAKDCYWLERPLKSGMSAPVYGGTDYTSELEPSTLQMHNNCSPCCACDDYVAVYKNMYRLWQRAKVAAATIESVRQKYQALRELLVNLKATAEVGLTSILRLTSRPDFTVSIMGVVANNSGTDILSTITLKFDLTYTPDVLTATYVARSGVLDAEEQHGMQIEPTIGSESFEITLPYLRKTRFAVYSFDVRFGKSSDPEVSRTEVAVKTVLTATGGSQTSTMTRFVTLEKPITKT